MTPCGGAACTGASRSGFPHFGLGEPSWASSATGARGCQYLQRVGHIHHPEGTCGPSVRQVQMSAWLAWQAAALGLAAPPWEGKAQGEQHPRVQRHLAIPFPPYTHMHRGRAPGLCAGGLTRGCPTRVSHPGVPAPSPSQRLTPRGCCLEPALTETLFLHLHNAELPLRWEGRSWDTRQGTGTWPVRGAVNLPSWEGTGARSSPLPWEAAASWHRR